MGLDRSTGSYWKRLIHPDAVEVPTHLSPGRANEPCPHHGSLRGASGHNQHDKATDNSTGRSATTKHLATLSQTAWIRPYRWELLVRRASNTQQVSLIHEPCCVFLPLNLSTNLAQ